MYHNFKTSTYLHTVSQNIGSVYVRGQVKNTYIMKPLVCDIQISLISKKDVPT